MEISKNIRESKKNILLLANKKNKGHIPSAFSIINFVYLFYENKLNINNDFILSKGHGCLALYSVLEHFNYITTEVFFSFGDFDSILGGHPHLRKNNEIKASTGSLGHGLPIAVGKALAAKINQSSKKIFCLIGDGEANEGTTWESAILADNLKLNNLICIVDNNQSQNRSIPTPNLQKKFSSFGWDVITIDGHNSNEILSVFNLNTINPLCVIMNTKKGKGIADMESNFQEWHHKGITDNLLKLYIKEIHEEAIS